MRTAIAFVLVLSLSACASLPAHPPAPVLVADETIADVADYALTVLEAEADKALAAKAQYLSAYRIGLVPGALHDRVQQEFNRLADLGLFAVQKIREGVSGWPAMLALLRPVVDATHRLTGLAAQIKSVGVHAEWKRLIAGFALKALTSWVEAKVGGVR